MAQEFSRASIKIARIIYVYKNNQLIEGSPFSNYSCVHKALGLRTNSKICFRYIDTGKFNKQQYIISSEPIKDIK